MKPKHLFAFLFATFQLFNFSTVFGQANTFWHDRIDTTIYATTTGTNTYTGTNTNTNFNVNKYVRGLLVTTFIVNGNTGAATYRLVTASGTLSSVAIRKQNGAALTSGDIPDSSAVILLYYGNFWRLMGVHAAPSTFWSLTGNAGTTAGTNFLGTTDGQDVVFKRNSTEIARVTSAALQLGVASTTTGSLVFRNATNANTATINSGVSTGNFTLTLPVDDGTPSQFLQTDGSGVTSWQTVNTDIQVGTTAITGGTSGAIPFNGAGVYQEDATQLFWDNTNNRLGVGTASPTLPLEVSGSGLTVELTSSTASTGINYKASGGADFTIGRDATSTNFVVYDNANSNRRLSLTNTSLDLLSLGNGSSAVLSFSNTNNTIGTQIGISTTTDFQIYDNVSSASRLFMNTTGDVAIGTGTSPSARIDVEGSGSTPSSNTAEFHNSTGTSNSLVIRDDINWGFGINSWGTDAVKVLSMGSGTAPTTSPTDAFQLYSADISAGNAALFTRAEGGEIYSIGTEFGTQSNSALNIATNSTTRFTVQTDGGTQFSYRVIEKQGTDIASAATIVIPADGNTFELTGTTAVTLITTTGWQEGATITLIANENVTITNGTATSGANVTILLSGAANFNMTANDVLTLKLSSTTAGGQAWREASRSVN